MRMALELESADVHGSCPQLEGHFLSLFHYLSVLQKRIYLQARKSIVEIAVCDSSGQNTLR